MRAVAPTSLFQCLLAGPGLAQELLSFLSEADVLRYEPQGVDPEGWHELEVRLRGHKGKVSARKECQTGPGSR